MQIVSRVTGMQPKTRMSIVSALCMLHLNLDLHGQCHVSIVWLVRVKWQRRSRQKIGCSQESILRFWGAPQKFIEQPRPSCNLRMTRSVRVLHCFGLVLLLLFLLLLSSTREHPPSSLVTMFSSWRWFPASYPPLIINQRGIRSSCVRAPALECFVVYWVVPDLEGLCFLFCVLDTDPFEFFNFGFRSATFPWRKSMVWFLVTLP